MYKVLPILLFSFGLAITTEDIYDNSYALLIGIDKYKNVRPLHYAVKDAESIKEILVSTFDFPEDNVKLLINDEATLSNIKNSLSEISSSARENDRVLIYFAGHGDTYDLPEGGERGYFLPIDGKKDNLFTTSFPMDEINIISSMSESKHMLFLIDACYGGLSAVGARGLNVNTTPNYINKITEDKGRTIITAGGRDEEVLEKREWGHSAFTMNLIRGLKEGKADYNEDGYITANELGVFLKEKVTIDSKAQHTPWIGRMTSQDGEFVFVYSENTVVIQDKSTDEKLDLLLSKMDKLESQKKADTPLKKQNNNIENVGLSSPYRQKEYGAGFFATPTMTSFEFYNFINDHLELSVQYEHSIDKISSLLSGTQSNQLHLGQLSVIYSYVLNERYRLLLGGGLGYVQVLWTDTALDFNYFKTSAIGGLGVNIIKTQKLISTQIGCKLLFEISDQPHLDENGEVMFDKKIDIKPKIIFMISFPE